MSLKHKVQDRLEQNPEFRERKNKDRGIVNILIERYQLQYAIQSGILTPDRIVAMVQDYTSMDRAWRKILEEVPPLRGGDYEEKDQLETKKMSELGYNTPRAIGPIEINAEKHQPNLL